MSEMKSLTLNDKKYDGFVDPVARALAAASAVIKPASGESVTLCDSSENKLYGLRICGKTTQDGTPAPDTPIDLVSSVEGDSISIHVCGKNLFTGWEVGGIVPGTGADYAVVTQRRTGYLPIFAPGQKYSISGIPNTLYTLVVFYDTNKTYISRTAASPYGSRLVDPPVNAKYFRVSIYENEDVPGKIAEADAMAGSTMIVAGDVITEYERGKQIQTATISVPNGLHGVPVTSGGNYTDANGQQWICDEIDLARGVLVRRCGEIVIDGSGYVNIGQHGNGQRFCTQEAPGIIVLEGNHPKMVLSDRYEASPWTNQNNKAYCIGRTMVLTDNRFIDIDTTRAILQSEKPKCIYVLETPVEAPLPEEEIAAYNALRTYRGYTTVSNDAFAYMELEYAMDAKKYIDSVVSGTILEATVE